MINDIEKYAQREAYKALAEKMLEERDAYRQMLHDLIREKDSFLIWKGNNSRWIQQFHGVISHGYPSIPVEQLAKEKLGKVGYCWSQFGDFAVVSERKDSDGKD